MDAILAPETISVPQKTAQDLVAEANHRIANSLTLLVSMARMQASAAARRADAFSGAEVRLMLEGVAARIGTIGQLHRLLSYVPQGGCTNLMPHLRDVSEALVAALSSPEQGASVEHSGSDCLVLTRQVQPIILIVCEVFINAMKYAHPTGVPLVMRIDCAPAADGRLVLTISDDGVGLPEDFDPAKDGGLGFRVIRSLAAELGATLDIASTGLGLSFRLSVPASAMPSAKLS
jgi:two-component sensor histidine kinase